MDPGGKAVEWETGGAFAIKALAKGKSNVHIRLKMDSTTAIAYLNHKGGSRSLTLSHCACQLWQWCLQKGITPSAEHLQGARNVRADRESRTPHTLTEWMLHPAVCHQKFQNLGPCKVDLFAS